LSHLEESSPAFPLTVPAVRAAPSRWAAHLRQWQDALRRLLSTPLGGLGVSLIGLLALMAVSHSFLMATVWDRTTYHPVVGFDYGLVPHPTAPSAKHLLGTDSMGRDVLSQLLYGAKPSFGIGLLAGVTAALIATAVGVSAAYYGGTVDSLLMGLADVFILLPPPVILLVVGLIVDMSWPQLALIYGLFAGLGGPAVILRSYALSIKVKPYIEAARVAGGSHWHIIRTHFLPHMLPLMALNAMFTVAGSVLTEALLSFFGRTQLRMSWGTMIWFGQITFRLGRFEGHWHALLPPALAIMLFCGAFYMLGRALDDTLNPRLRRR
jgi:peptide/nickel transport system permease protein